MTRHFVRTAIFSLLTVFTASNEINANPVGEPIVTVQEGKLKGTSGKDLNGDDFYQFFGIPYAKPPTDELRFKPPQPIDPWDDVKDVSKVGSSCVNRDDLTLNIVGSEDCLFLNVYTKNVSSPESKLRPVMVYIHGGGYIMGSSRPGIYGPEFLMIKDIVLVTFNYRLGALGFLAFDDVELGVPGNMGLKDQTLALKWVQKNIANFNGDPEHVTIFGESAGSASVHAHILSPSSKGLFHQAIQQSGSTLDPWFLGTKNNAREILKQIEKSADTEKEALEILKELPAMEIFKAQEKMFDIPYAGYKRHFSAVIETPNDAAFLSKPPLEILKEGTYNKVPTMVGYTETEGMLIDLEKLLASVVGATVSEFELEHIILYDMNVTKGSEDSKRIVEILKNLYNTSDSNHYDELTDSNFLVGIIESLRLQLKTSEEPIYLYRMSLAGKLNFLKGALKILDKPGVGHTDDLGYLFHSDVTPEIKPGSPEDKSVRTFVELWTNFAQYGNPTPNDELDVSWKPVRNDDNIELLDIGEKLVIKEIPERKRLEVWWDILKTWPLVRFD